MSFDLRLRDGDVQIGSSGDLDRIIDTEKLAQDVLKILHTRLGDDPFNPSIGSLLTENDIGTIPDVDVITVKAEEAIFNSITQLQQQQSRQETFQTVTDAEKVVDIEAVEVERDSVDPRQYNVTVIVLSGALTPIKLEFSFFSR